MRKFKKILITGITGSGGSYLAEFIKEKNSKIKIYGIYRAKKNNYFNNVKNFVNFYKCDLNKFNQVSKVIKEINPDLIFHIASNADVRKSFDFPREIINNNNNCTLNLLEAIRINKIKPLIIICSTSEVYGQVDKKNIRIKEDQIIKPINPYAVSKTFQDLISYNYYKIYDMKIIITRMFTYINPRRLNLFASHWAYQIAKIEKGLSSNLSHGNLNSSRTFIDIKDAMEAYWYAALYGRIGDVYNIGGETKVKIKDILTLLIAKSKKKIQTKIDKNLLRKSDIKFQLPDVTKFKKHTDWKPKIQLDESLDNLLNEMRKKVIKEYRIKKIS